MMAKYLIPIPGFGGKYPITIGMVSSVLNSIKKIDPESEIHFSGVSSGSACAVLFILASVHNVDVTDIHDEFLDIIKKLSESSDKDKEGYYQKNDKFFDAIDILIKKYISDINQINGKLYIGYCRLSSEHGLEFKIASDFEDVHDLSNVIRASCHYSLVLRGSMYHEYRGDMCVDGIFMYDKFYVPGYKNIVLDGDVYDMSARSDVLLEPCKEKYTRLHNIGVSHQSDKELVIVEPDSFPEPTSSNISYIWGWHSKIATLWSVLTTTYLGCLMMLKCSGTI